MMIIIVKNEPYQSADTDLYQLFTYHDQKSIICGWINLKVHLTNFMKACIIALTTSLLLFACSESRVTSSWTAKDLPPSNYKKFLVLGLINEPDRTIRENMEQRIAADLKQLGYDAVCSCDEFSPKTFENLRENEALDKLKNSGIDAVLTIVLLDKTKERYYVPGRIYYTPYSIYYRRFWGYYSTMYGRVYAPGYYVTNTKYFWESNFYVINGTTELLYSAQSESFEPPHTSTSSTEYGKMIIKDMLKANVIRKR